MRLHDLREIHDAAQLDGGGRDLHGQQCVTGFAGGDEMADRADTTDARHQRRHLSKGPSLAKFFKAAHLCDMKMSVLDLPCFIQLHGNFGMAFNARDGVNRNTLRHHFTHFPKRVLSLRSGIRPASNSVSV